mmetsp:Transcript_5208/g.8013  ORF Transcript_5208/g.8013 Transcript_5208/m.8013 type:complete len:905 (+) Transcript_5208:75-2789(+)
MSELEELHKQISAKGDEIRSLKANKVSKQDLDPHIKELIGLKERYRDLNGGVEYAPPSAAPQRSPQLIELEGLIAAKGDEIRQLKANKAEKDVINTHVQDLLALKERYKEANGGVAYATEAKPEPSKKKKAAAEPAQAPAREGPSKKELNKMKRKEKRKGGGEKADGDAGTAPGKALTGEQRSAGKAQPPQITYHSKAEPAVSRLVMALTGQVISCVASSPESPAHQPYLLTASGSLSGDLAVARYLCRSSLPALLLTNPLEASQVDQWLDHCTAVSSSGVGLESTFALLEGHLADKTYLVGETLSLADIAVYVLVSGSPAPTSYPRSARWLSLVSSLLPQVTALPSAKGGKSSGKSKGKGEKQSGGKNSESEDTCPHLEGAVEGQVCTRFPPEPSGYLHIGHTKAALLNQYYAQRYKGKLIVRFDDTNPSKEKEEYVDNIIRDLATLNIKGDVVTHTSDHFDTCQKYARQMIKKGLAYMDDTEQDKMQAERLARVESYRRNTSPEENLELFEKLLRGDPDTIKFCLRAKIDMTSVNGTMRDPVLYRYNPTPHNRTGTKYKAYPTYDFACPIVDSIEGVTHALRTTEYNDRDEQYHWLQEAMGLRRVHILAYGKINFVHTVLSKRKLNWFVENGKVDGWNDPRFPTIQGCVRRGMQVDSLKNFIISQGASRRVINMEWDKFWSENKRVLEDISPRYMAVTRDTKVPFLVTNVPGEVVGVSIQRHPQKPEMGMRVSRRYNKLYLEVEDCQNFSEGEEVTLVRWGNFFIDKMERNSNGEVVSMEGRFNPDATNFSKTKKATWIAAIPELVPCQLVEFDHLITKPKLGDDDDFKDYVTPVSRAETIALADPYLRTVQTGEVIQLERKGFFRCDKAYGGSPDKPAVLFLIPDGRVKAMSTLKSALSHR